MAANVQNRKLSWILFVERSLGVGCELRHPDGAGQIDADWRRTDNGAPFLFLGPNVQVYMEDGEPFVVAEGENMDTSWMSNALIQRIRELFTAHAAVEV